jgi:hypothetical protein
MLILPTKQSRLRSLHSAAPAANVDSLTHRSDVLIQTESISSLAGRC